MSEKEIIVVEGNNVLSGEVRVSGAKNSALKLIAASLLGQGASTLHNVPLISDIVVMSEVLECLGATVERDGHTMVIDTAQVTSHETPYELVSKMRASISVLGPLVARFGQARVAMPGGCQIGARKIDMHLVGLEALGVEFTVDHGYLNAHTPNGLHGADVTLEFPSVGATENCLMAAVTAHGTTCIENAAREPEIVDLANMLNAMGGKVSGAGSSIIQVEGVPLESLHPCEHTTVGDRIEAGTFLVGGALTLPHPGFPTDLQAQFMLLCSLAHGTSMVTENVFENRFMFASELARMGADITIEDHHALVRGVNDLQGTDVSSTDLRAGAALVLAGIVAEGETRVHNIKHIDRGYEDYCGKLSQLGANVSRRQVGAAE